jgi:asparagine synthase (glutamine-hydrolysing)
VCGIFGWIARPGELPHPGLVAAATHSLYARGPDSKGYAQQGRVAFGARRLAIIDLTSGDQPVVTVCGRVAVMQNGEIYNYRNLRAELLALGHPLRTTGDTEILAYGYLAWGLEGLLARLDGMYAFAIHDRGRGLIHLARDRFGEKPLFYSYDGGELIFSSQLLTVARHPNVDFAINPVALEAYLALHFVPGDETMLSGIRKLPGGHCLTYRLDDCSVAIRRYWQLSPMPPDGVMSRSAAAGELRDRMRAAVRSRLVSDVPVGAFLSGGIDSSIIVACMAEAASDLKTFSVGFESDRLDESRHALTVARHFGTDHHHISFALSDFDGLLPDVVVAMDEPIGDQAMLPALWLARSAREQVTVVLSGEGADEVFGGYDYYRSHALPADWRAVAHLALRPFFPPAVIDCTPICWSKHQTRSGFPLLFGETAVGRLLRGRQRFNDTDWARRFAADYRGICDPLQAACFTDIATWLPDDLLVKYDKMAMAASLEGRCPYLTPSLVEWALQLPAQFKTGGRLTKTILREAFAGALPDGISQRPKQGFVLPLSEYFCGRGRELLLDHVRVSIDDAVLRNDALSFLVEQELTVPQPNGRNLFALLLYKLWLVHAYRAPKFRPTAAGEADLGSGDEWIGPGTARAEPEFTAR